MLAQILLSSGLDFRDSRAPLFYPDGKMCCEWITFPRRTSTDRSVGWSNKNSKDPHCVNVCVCVHVCAHMCTGALGTHASGGQRWASSILLNYSPPYFLIQSISWILELTLIQRGRSWWASGIILYLAAQCWDWQVCTTMAGFMVWMLGIKLKSSCLHDQDFTTWAISTALGSLPISTL